MSESDVGGEVILEYCGNEMCSSASWYRIVEIRSQSWVIVHKTVDRGLSCAQEWTQYVGRVERFGRDLGHK